MPGEKGGGRCCGAAGGGGNKGFWLSTRSLHFALRALESMFFFTDPHIHRSRQTTVYSYYVGLGGYCLHSIGRKLKQSTSIGTRYLCAFRIKQCISIVWRKSSRQRANVLTGGKTKSVQSPAVSDLTPIDQTPTNSQKRPIYLQLAVNTGHLLTGKRQKHRPRAGFLTWGRVGSEQFQYNGSRITIFRLNAGLTLVVLF